jgi:hypothetical protein
VEQRLDVLEAGEDAAPAAADIGEESRTDTELLLLGALGGLLLAGGIVLVVADRRRRAARNVRA